MRDKSVKQVGHTLELASAIRYKPVSKGISAKPHIGSGRPKSPQSEVWFDHQSVPFTTNVSNLGLENGRFHQYKTPENRISGCWIDVSLSTFTRDLRWIICLFIEFLSYWPYEIGAHLPEKVAFLCSFKKVRSSEFWHIEWLTFIAQLKVFHFLSSGRN